MTKQHLGTGILAAIPAALLGLVAAAGAARAQSVEEFYRGKTIDLLIGFSPGGAYDVYARMVIRHMANHIPGKPTIVAKQMTGRRQPGRGQLSSTTSRRRTALVIATADQSLPLQQALGDNTSSSTRTSSSTSAIRSPTTTRWWPGTRPA